MAASLARLAGCPTGDTTSASVSLTREPDEESDESPIASQQNAAFSLLIQTERQ
tara:strand:+ start:1985 stop:2146 length:162 start_codon:yes stop_codon:yes gene_type:complete